MLLLKIAYLIEGWLIPENAGPMFFYYNAVGGIDAALLAVTVALVYSLKAHNIPGKFLSYMWHW